MKYFLLLCLSYFYLNANAHIFVYHRFGDSKHQSTNTTLKIRKSLNISKLIIIKL